VSERRYDERELATILRNAAEIQSNSEAPTDPVGLTLAEIQRVAGEVGIEPVHIESAAASLDRNPSGQSEPPRKAPAREIFERTCDGDLDDLAWEEVVGELRATLGSTGSASAMGTTREWAGKTDLAAAHLAATTRNSRTRFRLIYNQSSGLVVGWFVSSVVAMLATLFIGIALGKAGTAALFVVLAILAAVATTLIGTSMLLGRWRAKNRRTVTALMSRLQALVPSSDSVGTQDAKTVTEDEASPIRIAGNN
jgi:hypothetical protein